MQLFPSPSPKTLALDTWRHVQRPQYMAKIELERRKAKAKTGHDDPKISNPRK